MTDNVDATQGRSNGINSERCDTNNESTSIGATSSRIANASSVGISNAGNLNFLVSEHEDEGEDMDDEATANCSTIPTRSLGSRCAIPVPRTDQNSSRNAPAEIPLEPAENQSGNSIASGDESDYSYDYEDEDDCHISGFLVPDPLPMEQHSTAAIPQNIPAETDSSHANESASKSCLSSKESSLDPTPSTSSSTSNVSSTKTNLNNAGTDGSLKKSSWKEPSQAAVNMSLRAESEKTGGKRRLASDLYKIMMNDTEDAGFSLEPASEDSMEKWKIKLFKFDTDSNLHKDLMALGLTHVELEMSFPDQYPFEPPFVRVVRPRFKRQTGFVMNGAICSELLTNEGWNPVNDIESVIVSIRSLLVVGNGRLEAAVGLSKNKTSFKSVDSECGSDNDEESNDEENPDSKMGAENNHNSEQKGKKRKGEMERRKSKQGKLSIAGQYSAAEARSAYSHLSDYHKKKGWDSTGWWARKG